MSTEFENGIIASGPLGPSSPSRPDAAILVSNEGGGHALVAIKNHDKNDESAISYQALLDNGQETQAASLSVQWAGLDNSVSSAFNVMRFNVTWQNAGQLAGDIAMRIFGNKGVSFFAGEGAAGDGKIPGPMMVENFGNEIIHGTLKVGSGPVLMGGYSTGGQCAYIQGYNTQTSTWTNLFIGGQNITLSPFGTLAIDNIASTGSATPTLTANKPGSNSGVSAWLTVVVDGVTHYIPAWT